MVMEWKRNQNFVYSNIIWVNKHKQTQNTDLNQTMKRMDYRDSDGS